jgi:5'-3' exonuclease
MFNYNVLEVNPKHKMSKNHTSFHLYLNGEVCSKMYGRKQDDVFKLSGISSEYKFKGQGCGEKLIIEYLKKYGGKIFSRGGRTEKAEKMWQKLINRKEFNVEILNLCDYFKSYLISLK